MADIKISALPAASTLTGAETIPLVQGGVTKKVTTDKFLYQTDTLSVDAEDRLRSTSFIAGTETLTAPATRDAIVVGRDVTGLTDCHAFADRTVMDAVTDYGGYGVFDATTVLKGAHAHDHVHSFQDRFAYQGSGTLARHAGLYSAPAFSGSGTIATRYGAVIYDINKTGAGTVTSQTGLMVGNLAAATSNIGINVAQTAGANNYAIYAGGGAQSAHIGPFGIGGNVPAGVKAYINGGSTAGEVGLYVTKTNGFAYYAPGTGTFWQAGLASFGPENDLAQGLALTARAVSTGPAAFLHTTSTTVQAGGVGGDFAYQVVSNGGVRLEVTPSSGSYAVRPGADNTQPLGDVTKRWNTVYAGTGTINTSDAREKTGVRAMAADEIEAAKALSKEIGIYQFLDSVAKKGDKARHHVGLTVQRAIELMEFHGLDPFAYGFICFDKWDEATVDHPAIEARAAVEAKDAVFDEEGNVIEVAVDAQPGVEAKDAWTEVTMKAGDLYGFRYDQLNLFIARGIEARLAAIEAK